MKYIGIVTTEVIDELRKQLGARTCWDACYNLDSFNSGKIMLQGFYYRAHAMDKSSKIPESPSFWSLSEEDFIKRYTNKKLKDVTILDNFQPIEKWIELYELELEKYYNGKTKR